MIFWYPTSDIVLGWKVKSKVMALWYATNDMVLGWKVKGQRSRLGLTAIRRGFELYECLLVFNQQTWWWWWWWWFFNRRKREYKQGRDTTKVCLGQISRSATDCKQRQWLVYDELAAINQCHSARLAGVPRARITVIDARFMQMRPRPATPVGRHTPLRWLNILSLWNMDVAKLQRPRVPYTASQLHRGRHNYISSRHDYYTFFTASEQLLALSDLFRWNRVTLGIFYPLPRVKSPKTQVVFNFNKLANGDRVSYVYRNKFF